MPLYQVKCKTCAAEEAIWRKIADRDSVGGCNLCGGDRFRLITAPMLSPDIEPFMSPNDRYIGSRAQWKEDLKRSGAIPWEKGIDKDIARQRERVIEDAFIPISKAVDEKVAALATAGKLEI